MAAATPTCQVLHPVPGCLQVQHEHALPQAQRARLAQAAALALRVEALPRLLAQADGGAHLQGGGTPGAGGGAGV
jgi:hypothetical protein